MLISNGTLLLASEMIVVFDVRFSFLILSASFVITEKNTCNVIKILILCVVIDTQDD